MFSFSTVLGKNDLFILPLFKGEKLNSSHKKVLKKELIKAIEWNMEAAQFEGEEGEQVMFFSEDKSLKRVVLLGRGEKEKLQVKSNEVLGALCAQIAEKNKAETLSIWSDHPSIRDFGFGFILGNYKFSKYQKVDKNAKKINQVNLIFSEKFKEESLLKDLLIYKNSFQILRDLVNTSAGELRTKELAEAAKQVAKKCKLDFTLLDSKKLKKLGCGALSGVGQGAEEGPKLVILRYKYKTKKTAPAIAFVGKGITFDTGGLNLKPTGYIETMKQDMTGAATVLASMQAIAEMKIPGYFIGVMAIAENSVSDRSIRPGDVLKAYNGKTIEVTNTDAEGRLVLADALSYTEKNYKPERILDIATLTGAVSVALGYQITGVLGNDEKWMEETLETAKAMNERLWRLPLDEDFVKATKGDFTDLKNSSNGIRGDTCMGAAFLKSFVEKTPWLHFDVGGTAWANNPNPTTRYGATGVLLRSFVELARRHQG